MSEPEDVTQENTPHRVSSSFAGNDRAIRTPPVFSVAQNGNTSNFATLGKASQRAPSSPAILSGWPAIHSQCAQTDPSAALSTPQAGQPELFSFVARNFGPNVNGRARRERSARQSDLTSDTHIRAITNLPVLVAGITGAILLALALFPAPMSRPFLAIGGLVAGYLALQLRARRIRFLMKFPHQ